MVVELRQLRIEQSQQCEALAGRLDDLRSRTWWLVSELVHSRELGPSAAVQVAQKELLEELEKLLSKEAGLPVALQGQPVEVVSGEGGVEVANPTDVSGVESAVASDTETANQNLWALAGLLCGAAFLVVVWKLVRP